MQKYDFLLKTVVLAIIIFCFVVVLKTEAKSIEAKDFIEKASISNLFEIESSKVALKKSQNNNITEFAQHMIKDHLTLGSELESTMQETGLDASFIKGTLDKKHNKILSKLQKKSIKDFDKEYVSVQIDAHKDAIKLFQDYSKNGDSLTLRNFAKKKLPLLEQHYEKAKKVKSAL
ncbi:MAG: hypothetical protein K0R98_588 [Rickettsiaceae bacterium]|jgi:putative membrane protein|nr:hypothetical protein [Rickettsiaceae bacterium]